VGEPNGVLRDNAMALMSAALPPKSEQQRVQAFKRAFAHLLSLGRGLHSLTSQLNLRTFGTHRSR